MGTAVFRFFESQQNLPSASAQAAEIRSERRSVVSSLMGRQAPLGNSHGQGSVQLRTETSRNAGSRRMRQMSVGDYNVEVLGNDAMNDRNDEDSLLRCLVLVLRIILGSQLYRDLVRWWHQASFQSPVLSRVP